MFHSVRCGAFKGLRVLIRDLSCSVDEGGFNLHSFKLIYDHKFRIIIIELIFINKMFDYKLNERVHESSKFIHAEEK